MTEKRYVEELWAYDDIMVKDNETGEELWNNMIYERMNEQDEQIKELEIELRNKTVKWEYELGMKLKYHSKLIDSEKENEQLKSTNMEMEDYLGRLEEENKQLKGEIKYLQSELHNATFNIRKNTLKEVKMEIEKLERWE